jgi:hypothetical protein
VWSLWLSSLVVGYAIILWSILGHGFVLGWRVLRSGFDPRAAFAGTASDGTSGAAWGKLALVGSFTLVGALFMVAFFTVHFGGFHFVHSVFLRGFFPLEPAAGMKLPDLEFYGEVFRRYGWFLPAAALAERAAFQLTPDDEAPDDLAVTPAAIAARKSRNARRSGMKGLMAPYRNVVRLHLLIFFFAAAHFAKIESFIVYTIVYAVYFFPWRVLRPAPQD